MSASAGKVLWIPKGDYDNSVTYQVLDWVRYNDKGYVCKKTSLGHLPTDTTYWQLFVQDGTSPNTKVSYFDNGILGAKNLIRLDVESQTVEDVVYTVNSDGTITANGTATANGSYFEIYSVTLPAGSYTKTGCPSGGSASTYHFAGSNTGDDTGSGATFTLAAATTCQFVISVEPGETVTNVIFSPMLRLATDVDDTFRPGALTNKEITDKLADIDGDIADLDTDKADVTDLDTFIGPVYSAVNNSVYSVVFDDLDNSCGYQLCGDDALISWTSESKGTGTNTGIKLTFVLNSTYTDITTGQSATITAGSGGTPFYLRVMK